MNRKKTNTIFHRLFITLIFMSCIICAKAQINCEISLPDDVILPVCHGEEITLSVEYNSTHTYQWSKNGVDIQGETGFLLNIAVTENNSKYGVRVIDTQTQEECNSEITISMTAPFNIEFEQTQLTCSNYNAENGQNAKVIATASGEGFDSFIYEWGNNVWTNPNNPQEAIGLMAWREYYVDVTGITSNGHECTQRATFTPKAYPNPKVEIVSTPRDTAYIQNPNVTFNFEANMDSIEHNSWSWAFYNNPENLAEISNTSIEKEAVNSYYTESAEGSPYRVELTIKSADYGCDTTYSSEIVVLPVKLKIPDIFTPNGDGINDFFIISNDPSVEYSENDENVYRGGFEYESYNPLSDYYLSTKLTIFNRWGRVVYKSSDYKNDWDGGNLPDGNYFYVLECIGKRNNHRYQGSVTIFGSGR